MNCVCNGKILQETQFKKIYVGHSPADVGNSIGSAAYVLFNILGSHRVPINRSGYLGPSYEDQEIESALLRRRIKYQRLEAPHSELAKLIELGESLGLDALVEVHDEGDIEKALSAGAKIIGINNRDLTTFKTDIATTEKLVEKIPESIPVLSESGIATTEDVKRVRALGVRGILVGISVLQSSDPLSKINELKRALV